MKCLRTVFPFPVWENQGFLKLVPLYLGFNTSGRSKEGAGVEELSRLRGSLVARPMRRRSALGPLLSGGLLLYDLLGFTVGAAQRPWLPAVAHERGEMPRLFTGLFPLGGVVQLTFPRS